VDKRNDEMVGNRVRELFPGLTVWYGCAYRSAILGEKVVEHGFFDVVHRHLNITANQVISPGYCAFTYIVPDDYAPYEDEDKQNP
jgi:hypothetical protein